MKPPQQTTPKMLIVYFSQSGFTERIAHEIADTHHHHFDIESLELPKPRRGFWGRLKTRTEAICRRCPKILPTHANLSDYDLVIVGTPLVAGIIAAPVRTFLRDHCSEIRDAAFFCTSSGPGQTNGIREMERLCHHDPVTAVSVTDRELGTGHYIESLSDFVGQIEERFAA